MMELVERQEGTGRLEASDGRNWRVEYVVSTWQNAIYTESHPEGACEIPGLLQITGVISGVGRSVLQALLGQPIVLILEGASVLMDSSKAPRVSWC